MTETINGVAVIEKAIKVLEFLVNHPSGVSLGKISKNLNMSKSTVYRILSTFREYNYVTQNPQTGFYSLGGRMLIYKNFISSFDFSTFIYPYMQQFTDLTGLSTNLTQLENNQSVTIKTCVPVATTSIKIEAEIGYHAELYCSASGKIFLTGFNDYEYNKYIETEKLLKIAPRTITDPEMLKQDIARTTSRGYSIEYLENEEHIISLGAPIYDIHGNICAAIATMMLALNASDDDIKRLGAELKKTAYLASQALGYSYTM